MPGDDIIPREYPTTDPERALCRRISRTRCRSGAAVDHCGCFYDPDDRACCFCGEWGELVES